MPWHRRRRKSANVGTVIVVLLVAVICLSVLAWAGIVLEARVISSDAGG